MPGIILYVLGLAILLAVSLWAINRLAPEPIKTWATVVVVVLVGVWIACMLMGYVPTTLPAFHR